LIQALDTHTQIKFQTYYYLLLIAGDFRTLFVWVARKRVLCERRVAYRFRRQWPRISVIGIISIIS
jgi:hypothetical protein